MQLNMLFAPRGLTKRYRNFFYFDRVPSTYTCMVHLFWATVCQSQHKVKTITVCQAFIMNSDERGSKRRERRAAESSEERETQLAKHRVADRATCRLMRRRQPAYISCISGVYSYTRESGR